LGDKNIALLDEDLKKVEAAQTTLAAASVPIGC